MQKYYLTQNEILDTLDQYVVSYDKSLRDVLIFSNFKYVENIVYSLNMGDLEEDLMQVGVLALIESIKTYNPGKRSYFFSYIHCTINRAIQSFIHKNNYKYLSLEQLEYVKQESMEKI